MRTTLTIDEDVLQAALSNIQSAILEYLTVAEELAQTCELREVEVAV